MRIGEATNSTDLLAALEAERTHRAERRRPFETVWWNNIALVAGDHFATWNPQTASFQDIDPNFNTTEGGKKPRIVINHAQTVARTELAKLTKSRPVLDIMANSDEADDLAAVKVGLKVLEGLEWKLHIRKLRKQALWWMVTCGIGAEFVGWDYLDDAAGNRKFTIDPNTDEPVFNPDRIKELQAAADKGEGPKPIEEEYPLGDIDYRVYNPFQLYPPDNVLEWDQLHEIIVADVWDIDVLQGCYGAAAKDVVVEDVTAGAMERRLLERSGFSVVPSGQAQATSSSVRVHTWWCEPGHFRGNPYLKDGKMIRWCQGSHKLEESSAFPYSDGRLPFSWYMHIPANLTIWPRSVMEDIREANLELDKTVSQLIENKDYMSNPMWLVATQHRLKNKIRNVAGSIVRYTHVPGIPEPQPVQGMQMPPQVENLVVALRDQILDVSGQSEVSRGRMPSGVRSGVQVAYLQEEDDTKIATSIENMELAGANTGSLMLTRVSQFYATQRILGFYRRDGKFDVVKFKGVDLKSNTHVITQLGSAMPKSKAARQQYTLELVGLGIEKDPKRIKDMLELGYGEPDEDDLATAQANRENNIMLHGMDMKMFTLDPNDPGKDQEVLATAVPVKKWHNHEIHVARHRSQMMDEAFDDLQISHPEIVRLFDEHVAMHEQIIAEQQQQQMQMMLAMKGAPDGPPTPAGGAPAGAQDQQSIMAQTPVADAIGGGVSQIQSRQTNAGPTG